MCIRDRRWSTCRSTSTCTSRRWSRGRRRRSRRATCSWSGRTSSTYSWPWTPGATWTTSRATSSTPAGGVSISFGAENCPQKESHQREMDNETIMQIDLQDFAYPSLSCFMRLCIELSSLPWVPNLCHPFWDNLRFNFAKCFTQWPNVLHNGQMFYTMAKWFTQWLIYTMADLH